MEAVMSPYTTKELYGKVPLYPNQLNNHIYVNIKDNLKKKFLGKCYRDYGYICDIYEVTKYDRGIIKPENFSGSVLFEVSFNCRICIPIKNSLFAFKIVKESPAVIHATNGPIVCAITEDRISDRFTRNQITGKTRYKSGEKYINLNKGDIVIVKIINISFGDSGDRIVTIGEMIDIGDDDHIKEYEEDQKKVPKM